MEVLIGSEAIQGRVREIGRQIARDHPEGAPLLIGVLRGCVIFMADLMKCLPIPHEIDFISISSYESSSTSSGVGGRLVTTFNSSPQRTRRSRS